MYLFTNIFFWINIFFKKKIQSELFNFLFYFFPSTPYFHLLLILLNLILLPCPLPLSSPFLLNSPLFIILHISSPPSFSSSMSSFCPLLLVLYLGPLLLSLLPPCFSFNSSSEFFCSLFFSFLSSSFLPLPCLPLLLLLLWRTKTKMGHPLENIASLSIISASWRREQLNHTFVALRHPSWLPFFTFFI